MGRKISEIFDLGKIVLKKHGIRGLLKSAINVSTNELRFYKYKFFKPNKTFLYRGKEYQYLRHSYNTTWLNERTIEVPIIWKEVQESKGIKILEVGNVLNHYFKCHHDVLDKYEESKGVINEDVVYFNPKTKYGLIVSISTLEHVGWDEVPKDSKKIIFGINNLKKCLVKGGRIIATMPLGYNPEMDKTLKNKKLPFTKFYYLKRISSDNLWKQVNYEEVKGAKYGSPFGYANAIVIGVFENK